MTRHYSASMLRQVNSKESDITNFHSSQVSNGRSISPEEEAGS